MEAFAVHRCSPWRVRRGNAHDSGNNFCQRRLLPPQPPTLRRASALVKCHVASRAAGSVTRRVAQPAAPATPTSVTQSDSPPAPSLGVPSGGRSCYMAAMWDHWYRVLAKMVRAQGPAHALRVAGPHAEHLEDFVAYNRRMAARNALPEERVMLLDRLGFIWDAAEATWIARYEDMVAWHARSGTFVVPRRENPTLAQWARIQRSLKTRGLLSPRRTQLLKLVGFPLEPVYDCKWQERYNQLVAVHKSQGPVDRLPASPDGRNCSLARWLRLQRRLHWQGTLAQDRVRKLDALNMLNKPVEDAWNRKFQLIVDFKEEHGHTEVPQCSGLGRWVHRQRSEYISRKLPLARQRRLDEIGFSWNAREAKWERRFQELSCYYNERPPENRGKKPKENAVLAKWLENQHLASDKQRLDQDRSAKLAGIGIQLKSNKLSSTI